MDISINLAEDIYPISEIESKATQLIKKARTTKRPLIITEEGRSAVVILDINEFQSLTEQVNLMLDVLDITYAEHGPFTNHETVKNRYARLFESFPNANTSTD